MLILIFAGVLVWALAGEPVFAPTVENTEEITETATTTGQTGPLTPSQLEARVVVDAPMANATISSPITVSGKAPGPWYFEASFPIEVRSATGTVLGVGVAQAQGEWMTTDDVPFTVQIDVKNYKGPATIVLHRDNASGLPEHDASVSVPIIVQ